MPKMIESGMCASAIHILAAVPPTIPSKTVNRTITKTSSMEEAANTRVGMPLRVPRPRSMKSIIKGTTTAGETAAKIVPKRAASM